MDDRKPTKIITLQGNGIDDAERRLAEALQSTSCREVKLDGEWYFKLENEAVLRAGCLWRVLVSGQVALTNCDNNQMFGLKSPVDAAQEATRLLFGRKIVSVALDGGTADLRLHLSDETTLEVLNNSSGYEPWGFSSKGATLVATASGNIFLT